MRRSAVNGFASLEHLHDLPHLCIRVFDLLDFHVLLHCAVYVLLVLFGEVFTKTTEITRVIHAPLSIEFHHVCHLGVHAFSAFWATIAIRHVKLFLKPVFLLLFLIYVLLFSSFGLSLHFLEVLILNAVARN